MKTSLKLYLTALAASFLLLLGACSTNTNSSTSKTESSSSAPTEITIKDSLDEVKLSKAPEKIVTFDLGAADTIRALGFEKNIVGMPTKTVPTYLKDLAGNVNNVGSMVEPDLEAIAALEPDLIIASPRTQKFVDKFKEEIPRYMIKHQVRPGMTGWAQVNGYRGDTSITKRIEHDLYYIENWTLGFDFKIMFLTVFKGFINKNAY